MKIFAWLFVALCTSLLFSVPVHADTKTDAEDVTIKSIEPIALPVSCNSRITISGTGFGTYSSTSKLIFLKDDQRTDWTYIPKKDGSDSWTKDSIVATVPNELATACQQACQENADCKFPKISIRVFDRTRMQTSNTVQLNFVHNVVADAIRLKKTQISDQGIIDHLFNQQEAMLERDPDAPTNGLFGAIKLSSDDVAALKAAGFDEPFISKLEGQHQYFSVGASALYLFGSDEWVGAGLARIFLRPKGYYSPRKPIVSAHWSTKTNIERLLKAPFKSYFWDRVDVVIGATGSASTSSSGNSSSTNYIITGGSLEITRFLHFVGGAAFAGDKPQGNRYQTFVGINVDPNIVNIGDLLSKVNILKQ